MTLCPGKEWHDRKRECGENDPYDAFIWCRAGEEGAYRVGSHIDRQSKEKCADYPERNLLSLRATGLVAVTIESPDRSQAGGHLDEAIQAEAQECDAARRESRCDRDQAFQAVIAEGGVIEEEAPTYKVLPQTAISVISESYRDWWDRTQLRSEPTLQPFPLEEHLPPVPEAVRSFEGHLRHRFAVEVSGAEARPAVAGFEEALTVAVEGPATP